MLRHARIAIASLLVIGGTGLGFGLGSGCGSTSGPSMNPGGSGGRGGSGSGGIVVNFDAGGPLGSGGAAAGATGTGNTAGATPTGSLVFLGRQPALLTMGSPCTFEEGATGDRWCAFTSGTELYVVNVSKAAAGTSISCGMTDANCLKLTSTFFQEAVDPVLHFGMFQGDTLTYFDATGTPFGWRPGMTAGRALATADAGTKDVLLCAADIKGSAVTCLRDLPAAMQTDPQLLLSDILAGRVDGAANPPLAKVETVIAASSADVNISHFQLGFPVPGGDTLAWSARGVKGGPEILKTQTLGNDASRATVATNVNGWRASPDGARWYWLSAVNESTLAGTLQSAPFPGGASPTMVAPNALQFEFPTPTSLAVVNTTEQLLGFADQVGAPTQSQMLDTGVIGVVNVSAQGHLAYAKNIVTVSNAPFVDLFVKKVDGTGTCTITPATDGYLRDFFFNPSATGVSWVQRTNVVMARFTRMSDCTATDVGSGVVWTEPAGDRGVLYIDSFLSANGTGVLKYRALGAGAVLSTDPPTLVSGQVGSFRVVSSAGLDLVVYTINGGGTEDGVYVRSFGP